MNNDDLVEKVERERPAELKYAIALVNAIIEKNKDPESIQLEVSVKESGPFLPSLEEDNRKFLES